MKCILQCDCGSTDFKFHPSTDTFECEECGAELDVDEAGQNLIEEETN